MAATIGILVALATILLPYSGKFVEGKGPKFYAIFATAFSALGLLPLSLITGQETSPFLWILPVLPAYAFYFLSHVQALAWTAVALGTVVFVHWSHLHIKITPEGVPGSWERCIYQLLSLIHI